MSKKKRCNEFSKTAEDILESMTGYINKSEFQYNKVKIRYNKYNKMYLNTSRYERSNIVNSRKVLNKVHKIHKNVKRSEVMSSCSKVAIGLADATSTILLLV